MLSKVRSAKRLVAPALCIAILFAWSAVAQAQKNEPPSGFSKAVDLFLPYTSAAGEIKQPLDVQYFKFGAEAGREVTIWVSTASIGSTLVPILALYNKDGKVLAYSDKEWNLSTGEFADEPILYVKIPETAVYYLGVMSSSYFKRPSPLTAGTVGNYEIYLLTNFASTIIGDPFEPNDTLKAAAPINLPFAGRGTNLIYCGDIDWYSFSAKKGEKLSLDIDAMEMQDKDGWDLIAKTRLGVFDRSGALLVSTDTGYDPETGFYGDPAIAFDVPQDGKYYVAVASIADSMFATPFTNEEFLEDPYVSGTNHIIGSYLLSIKAVRLTYFTQIANGSFGEASFATSMIFVNSSSETIGGSVQLFKSDGTPFLGVFGSSSKESDTAWFQILPKSSAVIKTNGLGDGSSGYGIVTSTDSISGCAVFSQYDHAGTLLTEAAVASSPLIDFFMFPAEVSGDFNTGLAIANLEGTSKANLYLKLVDATGKTISTRDLSLDPGRQMSIFLGGKDQLFPGLANFRGSVQVLSDTPVGAVALRTTEKTLTTLPTASLNQSFDPALLQFPHVVFGSAGNYYRTTIILNNSGYFPVSGKIQFRRSDGTPMPVSIGSASSSSHSFNIPALGTVFLEASSTADLETGYAWVEASHSVGGVLIYSQFDRITGKLQTEVGVSASPAYTDFVLFAQSENGYNTGLAVANTGSAGSSLSYQLNRDRDSDPPLQKGPVPLDPGRQRADLIAGANQLFPGFAGRGALEVTSTVPIVAVALRITATTMTALPIIPAP
jgi:hypothetical protein